VDFHYFRRGAGNEKSRLIGQSKFHPQTAFALSLPRSGCFGGRRSLIHPMIFAIGCKPLSVRCKNRTDRAAQPYYLPVRQFIRRRQAGARQTCLGLKVLGYFAF
jgi:hypothetical protein